MNGMINKYSIDNATISIIIPAKNEGLRLPKCLSAVKASDCESFDLEIIVIDNGSQDNTVEIAKNYGVITHVMPSATISCLRNYGAGISKGNFLAFIDADVETKPDFLQKAMQHFGNPRIGIVTGLILIPDKSTWVEQTWCLNRTTTEEVREANWASSMNMVVRREVFFKAGGFSSDMRTCEDVDFCLKVRKLNYLINYDRSVQVIHFGEAKNLREFYKKERWRGIASWQLARKNLGNLRVLTSFLQAPFFFISFLLTNILFLLSDYKAAVLFLIATIFLPIYRATVISKKNRSLKYFNKLLVVWFIYYFARAVSLFKRKK